MTRRSPFRSALRSCVAAMACWCAPCAAQASSQTPLRTPPQAPPTVRTATGLVAGVLLDRDAGLRVFRGIPYAAPPIGPLRWRPPQPPAAWDGVREAERFAKVCPQSPLIAYLSREELPATSEDSARTTRSTFRSCSATSTRPSPSTSTASFRRR